MSPNIKQWSFSTLKTYNTCPRKIKLGKIDRIREPGSPQMDRGNAIHEEAENYIRHNEKVLPDSLKLFKKEFKELQKLGAVAEEEVAYTRKWEPCAWASPDAWVRAKIDVYHKMTDKKGRVSMRIIDYKTGKVYEENKKQLSFYALLGFISHPEVDLIEVELWYLDQGPEKTHRDSYVRSEMEDMQLAWTQAPAQLMHDTVFAPRPGMHCRWCFYAKNKAGHCEF